MKIQKPGRAVGLARTLPGCVSTHTATLEADVYESEGAYPQKIRQSENMSCATLPAVSAESMPAIIMSVKVLVKIKNIQMYKNISPPRSATWPVGIAFL